jgi:hypothetical protein
MTDAQYNGIVKLLQKIVDGICAVKESSEQMCDEERTRAEDAREREIERGEG